MRSVAFIVLCVLLVSCAPSNKDNAVTAPPPEMNQSNTSSLIILSSAERLSPAEEADWKACTQDSDCVIAGCPCGPGEIVNERFVDDWYKMNSPPYPEFQSCTTQACRKVIPRCVVQQCTFEQPPQSCEPAWVEVNGHCALAECFADGNDNISSFRYQAQCLRSLEKPEDLNRELYVWVPDGTITSADKSFQTLKKRLRPGDYAFGGYQIDYYDDEQYGTKRSMTGAGAIQLHGYYITLTRAASLTLKEWTNKTDPVIDTNSQRVPEDDTELRYCEEDFDCARVATGCCCGTASINRYFVENWNEKIICSQNSICTGQACVIGPLSCVNHICTNPFNTR